MLVSQAVDDCECDSEILPEGLFDVLAPLRDQDLYSLVESDEFFAFVVGGRGTS